MATTNPPDRTDAVPETATEFETFSSRHGYDGTYGPSTSSPATDELSAKRGRATTCEHEGCRRPAVKSHWDQASRRKLVRLTRIALTNFSYGSGHSNQVRAWLTRVGLQDPCWELDHTVPVCEGGGCCGPAGLRVLCIPCHRAVTASLARRRGLRKKLERGSTT